MVFDSIISDVHRFCSVLILVCNYLQWCIVSIYCSLFNVTEHLNAVIEAKGRRVYSLPCGNWSCEEWELCVCVFCGTITYYLSIYLLSFIIHIVGSEVWLKSTDLSINPHISLNPWNPQIHGAILRFIVDFYCEIQRFHGNPQI